MKHRNKLVSWLGLLVSASLILAACAPAATPAPTTAPQPTTAPATVAPAATAAPTTAAAATSTVAPTTAAATAAPTTAATTAATSATVEIKFAFFGPLTGPAAGLGTEQLALARIAVSDFNKNNPGYHATMVEEDTDITADKAVPVCTKDAADSTIVGIVGPSGSGQVQACAKILEDAGIAHVSPSATNPALSQGGNKTFFRVVPNDDAQGTTDGNYIADTLKAKKVFVIDDKETYGTGLSDNVEKILKAKGVTTQRTGVDQSLNDFSSLATTIKGFGPDLVFFAGQVPTQGASLAKALKDQGLSVPIFGGDGFYSQKDYIDSAGGATEGSYASVFFPDVHGRPEAASVVSQADAAFPTWGNFGAATYVATTVFLDAAVNASKAGSLTRAGLVTALTQINEKVLGVSIKFDPTGEVAGASFVISQVKNGKFVQVFPATTSGGGGGTVQIKIAFFGPLTGPAASLGQEQLALARIAVSDFNKANPTFNVTMVEEDTDITADKAVPVCTKDAADNTILAVVGPSGSGQVQACAKILEDAGLGHVSGSATNPALSQGGNKTFFRVVPNDDVQGQTDGNYIASTLNAKKVFVIDDKESYGTNLSDTVEKILKGKGVTTQRQGVDQSLNDFSSLATTIKGFGPDVVFFAGQVASQGAALAKALQDQGVKIPVFGGDGFYSQKDYIDGAGGATEGSYASVFFPDIRSKPDAASVVSEADAAFPSWGNFGAATYVATTVVLDAAMAASNAGNLTRAGIVTALTQTNVTVVGVPIKFDPTGEVSGASFVISQVKNAKFVQVFPQ